MNLDELEDVFEGRNPDVNLIETDYVGKKDFGKSGGAYESVSEGWLYKPNGSDTFYRVPFYFLSVNLESDIRRDLVYVDDTFKSDTSKLNGKFGRFYIIEGDTLFMPYKTGTNDVLDYDRTKLNRNTPKKEKDATWLQDFMEQLIRAQKRNFTNF